jgi:hypothetical protein
VSKSAPRRSKYLLFPRFQLTLLAANVAVVAASCGVIWLQVSRALADLRVFHAGKGEIADYYQRYLTYQSERLELVMILSLFLGLGACAVLTIFLSHKFSGPLVNLKHHFERLRTGLVPRPELKFRRGDFLSDLPPLINEAVRVVGGDKAAAAQSQATEADEKQSRLAS